KVVIGNARRNATSGVPLLCPDELPACENPPPGRAASSGPDALAWVIFTSGSTGAPKAVAVAHRAATNHMRAMALAMPLRSDDRVLHMYSPVFDAALAEIFPPLLSGATVVIAEAGRQLDMRHLIGTMASHGVTVMDTVPSLLRALLDEPSFGQGAALR